MSYTSRVRYRNRREKLKKHGRNFRLIVLFGLLITGVLLFRHRRSIWDYLMTYFY